MLDGSETYRTNLTMSSGNEFGINDQVTVETNGQSVLCNKLEFPVL